MKSPGRSWLLTAAAAALSAAVWIVAAKNGHALETVWLPAVVVGATWPARARRACAPRAQRRKLSVGGESQP
jgi:hypothetical protein